MNTSATNKPIGPVAAETDASEYLNLSPNTLEADRRSGKLGIPYIKMGRRIGYLVTDLDLWIENNRVVPPEKYIVRGAK